MTDLSWSEITRLERANALSILSGSDSTPTQPLPSAARGAEDATGMLAWGLGGPPLLPPAVEPGEVEHIWGWFDLHFPYHEPELWDAALRALAEQHPHRLILGGDAVDLGIISRWSEAQRKRMQEWEVYEAVKAECDSFKRGLAELRSVYDGELVYVSGNHCQRLEDWLGGFEKAAEWMGLTQAGASYFNRAGFKLRPNHIVMHGNFTGQNVAKKHVAHFGCSGWSGHQHDEDSHSVVYNVRGDRHDWTSSPTMARLDIDYGPGRAGLAKSHQGFLVGAADEERVHTDVARWWNGELWLRGERY